MTRARTLLVAFALVAACGGPSGDTTTPDGSTMHTDLGALPTEAPADSKVAYEGYQRFVTTITASGHDMTGATVVPAPGETALTVLDTRCNNVRCAVQLRVNDVVSESTAPDPVPAPIALQNRFLDVHTTDLAPLRATIGVFPAHTVGAHDMASIHDSLLVSGGVVDPGVVLRGAPVGGPPRWYVMGPLRMAGTIDASPRTDVGPAPVTQVVGGAAAGAAGATAPGASGGAAGLASAGGGGGGNATAGTAGESATGAAGGGGAGGAATTDAPLACLIDPNSIGCGGGGGGGAAGAGGPGAGGIFIASLEPLDLGGGSLLANGSDAEAGGGGGGGAGGMIFVAAPSWVEPATLSAAAGHGATQPGGGAGGDGADGRLRIDVPGVTVGGAWSGPLVDAATAPPITDQASIVLTGRAIAGATLHVEHVEHAATLPPVTATAAVDGSFSITVFLSPGTNRLRVSEDVPGSGRVQGWVGSSFEFGMDTCITRAVCVPKGALLDVAYVPASE